MMRIAHGLLTVCYVPFRVLGMFAHGLLTLCSRWFGFQTSWSIIIKKIPTFDRRNSTFTYSFSAIGPFRVLSARTSLFEVPGLLGCETLVNSREISDQFFLRTIGCETIDFVHKRTPDEMATLLTFRTRCYKNLAGIVNLEACNNIPNTLCVVAPYALKRLPFCGMQAWLMLKSIHLNRWTVAQSPIFSDQNFGSRALGTVHVSGLLRIRISKLSEGLHGSRFCMILSCSCVRRCWAFVAWVQYVLVCVHQLSWIVCAFNPQVSKRLNTVFYCGGACNLLLVQFPTWSGKQCKGT